MKLKFFIAGVAIVAGLASAVSCQDLSKDLTALQNKVNSLEATVQGLQAKIDAGAVITSVTPSNSGIVITLSNGNKYEITNGVNGKDGANGKDGKDGTPGSVVTIGDNGNWFIDGVDTGLAAKGKDGVDGKDGHGEYYVPNPETGKFDKYVWVEENGEGAYKKEPTDIPFVTPGTITAVYNTETGALTLFGVKDQDGKVIEDGVTITAGASEVVPSGEMEPVNSAAYPTDGYVAGDVYPPLVAVTMIDNDFFGMKFVKGEETVEPVTAYIRIAPKDAVLKAEDVCFVDSKGDVLPYVKAFEVEKQEDAPIVKAEAVTSAIWKVSYGLDMDAYDATAFAKAIYVDPAKKPTPNVAGNHIAYALKAGEAATDFNFVFEAPVVAATSNYLNLYIGGKAAANSIDFLNNRYSDGTAAYAPYTYMEKAWKVSTAAVPTPAAEAKGATPAATGANWNFAATITTANPVSDDRSATVLRYAANVGTEFEINAGTLVGTTFTPDPNIAALYVEIDLNNAPETSEYNAWKGYESKIAGLKTVQKGTTAKICINDEAANGDEIVFRVWAVNHNGTLVDPDGRAFSVQVGQEGSTWTGVATTLSTPAELVAATPATAFVGVSTTALAGATTYSFTMDSKNPSVKTPTIPAGTQATFSISFAEKKDGTGLTWGAVTPTASAAAPAIDFSKLKFVKATPISANLYEYADGQPYKGTLKIFDTNNRLLASLDVTFTKSMPTAIPADWWTKKAGQLTDDVYNVYPEAWNTGTAAAAAAASTTAATADAGRFNLADVITLKSNAAKFTATIANAKKAATWATDKKVEALPVNTAAPTTVDPFFIDNSTSYASKLVFNFGKVSSAKIKSDLTAVNDYTVDVYSFNTKFNRIFDKTNMTWAWNWAPLTYTAGVVTGSAYTVLVAANPAAFRAPASIVINQTPEIKVGQFTGSINLDMILGTSAWADNVYGGNISALAGGAATGNKIAIKTVKLTSDATGLADYYNVAVTNAATKTLDFSIASSTPLTVDVPSTLYFECYDQYGVKVEVKVPVTIVP